MNNSKLTYPKTAKESVADTYFGTDVADLRCWLENDLAANFVCIKKGSMRLLILALSIGLLASCNSDQHKPADLKVDQRTPSQEKSSALIKLSSGSSAFPLNKNAACCKGVPSRAKALAAKNE